MLTHKLLKQNNVVARLSHGHKTSTVVNMNWLTVTKCPFLKWQWVLPLYADCFLFSIPAINIPNLTMRKRNCLHFASSCVTTIVYVESVLNILYCVLVLFVVLLYTVPDVACVYLFILGCLLVVCNVYINC